MFGCCNSCGEISEIITVELTDDNHSYTSQGYSYTTTSYEEEVTECCEDSDWEEVDA
jgi:hypothetical protein